MKYRKYLKKPKKYKKIMKKVDLNNKKYYNNIRRAEAK